MPSFGRISGLVAGALVINHKHMTFCLFERPSSPYNKFRYLVVCKNPECLFPRYGSDYIADAGFATFLQGDWGVNFATKVLKALTLGAVNIKAQEECKCFVNGKSGSYRCGFTDCQIIDTKKNPNYWK